MTRQSLNSGLNKGLKISLYSIAIAAVGLPMSMATWVALALIGY